MEGYNIDEAIRYFKEKIEFTISCTTLKRKMDRGDKDYNLIDVRDIKSYNEGHLPGAKFLDSEDLENYWHLFSKDKLNIIYCYGMLCHKGFKISIKALEKGFPVADLLGNYHGWFNYPYEIEK